MVAKLAGSTTANAGAAWCIRALCIALLIALLTGCGSLTARQEEPTPTPLPPQPAVEKPTYTVQRGDIVEELELSGRVAATRQDDLAFTQAGNVATIYVRATDPITKGQLLMELNQGERPRQLEQARLALDQAKLALKRVQERQQFAIERAELDLEETRTRLRLAESAGERQLAEIGVRRAEINLAEARAATDEETEKEVGQAQLNYDLIKAQIDAARLYAPYDGQVGDIGVEAGAAVEAYAPVMSVIDPREREVRVESATATDLSRLSVQQQVTIRFSRYPDQPVTGFIERLPLGSTSTQSTVQADSAIHIRFEPGDLELDIGDLGTVVVTLQRKEQVLWLPPQAIREFQSRRFVVIQDGQRQRRVDVKVGIADADHVEIVSGLQEGQVVIGQ